MRGIILLVLLGVSGCASIIEGTSEEITLNTNPSGATCGLYREGIKIGELSSSPGSVMVKKTKYDITVACVKPGFQQATYLNHSGAAAATFGNIILGGGIGWAIDSASGADNMYDGVVNITLVPEGALSNMVSPPAPSPASLLPESMPVVPRS